MPQAAVGFRRTPACGRHAIGFDRLVDPALGFQRQPAPIMRERELVLKREAAILLGAAMLVLSSAAARAGIVASRRSAAGRRSIFHDAGCGMRIPIDNTKRLRSPLTGVDECRMSVG